MYSRLNVRSGAVSFSGTTLNLLHPFIWPPVTGFYVRNAMQILNRLFTSARSHCVVQVAIKEICNSS